MKRLIKYRPSWTNIHDRDAEANYSNCGTKIEVLPHLVSDNAGIKELREFAKKLGFGTNLKAINTKTNDRITHSLRLRETVSVGQDNVSFYLGFITIKPSKVLALKESVNNEIDYDSAMEIINSQAFGVDDVVEMISGETVLIMDGWDYFNELELHGYKRAKFEEVLGIDNTYFWDDVARCDACYKYDFIDDGYTYNHRELEGERLGINCGCYAEACESNLEAFIDNADKAMQLDTAENLEAQGRLKHVERLIGGMVDGRGGFYAGEYTREGNPESILKEYKTKFPKKSFVFSIDESGQFQTYFSIWQVKKAKKSPKASQTKVR